MKKDRVSDRLWRENQVEMDGGMEGRPSSTSASWSHWWLRPAWRAAHADRAEYWRGCEAH